METLRRASASFIAAVLALSPLNAGAVSLYDGIKTRPAVVAPVVPTQNLPVLPQLPTGLSPITTLDASIPQLPTLPVENFAAISPAAQLIAPAVQQTPAPLASLESTSAKLEAPGANQAATLDATFDAGIASHVGDAISEYFGVLAPGDEPGVVVSKKKTSGTQGAPTDLEMENNVKASPKTNPEREQIAIRMFQKGGAKYDPAASAAKQPDFNRDGEVQVQEVPGQDGSVSHNIFVVKKGTPKPGQKERIIVITSHNDKVEVGDGVIDNWTGTTMVSHLYQSIKDVKTEATYVFATFAREEEGLVGSKRFLRSLTPDQRALIEGNINYDTIAIKGGDTNSWDNDPGQGENHSDEVLLAAADAAVAQANKSRGPSEQLVLNRAHLNGGDADSSSFRWQRPPIPGMTIFSGPEDLVFSIIHSAADNIGAFDFALYKNTYLVALALISWLEAHPLAHASPVGNA